MYFLEQESIGCKRQIKIHKNLQNEQLYHETTTESPYSLLAVQNVNASHSSQVSADSIFNIIIII